MDAFQKIAEEKIKRAIEEGIFDNLSNTGKPLMLEDEIWVPEDLRLTYKILKNAGYLPPELELRNEIVNLKSLLNTIDDDKERLKKLRELNFKLLKLNMMRKKPINLEGYEEKVIERFIANSRRGGEGGI